MIYYTFPHEGHLESCNVLKYRMNFQTNPNDLHITSPMAQWPQAL